MSPILYPDHSKTDTPVVPVQVPFAASNVPAGTSFCPTKTFCGSTVVEPQDITVAGAATVQLKGDRLVANELTEYYFTQFWSQSFIFNRVYILLTTILTITSVSFYSIIVLWQAVDT